MCLQQLGSLWAHHEWCNWVCQSCPEANTDTHTHTHTLIYTHTAEISPITSMFALYSLSSPSRASLSLEVHAWGAHKHEYTYTCIHRRTHTHIQYMNASHTQKCAHTVEHIHTCIHKTISHRQIHTHTALTQASITTWVPISHFAFIVLAPTTTQLVWTQIQTQCGPWGSS